ncbi:MAG: 50S ribosomal protein L21 [Chloroflexi bacterium]|nr:50S ribosomal protein L21 [Chloroflexota bacterium]
MYAIIQTGGKQYRVSPGDHIKVEKLEAEPGSTVDLDQVLLVSLGEQLTLGRPAVADARVKAEVVSHGVGDKIVVFKYHAKTRYRRKTGHRQPYTELAIQEIVVSGRPMGQVAEVVAEPAEAAPEAVPTVSEEGPEYGS